MRRRVETDEGSRMERGVDSILRLFRVFFFTLARTVSSNFLFFFSNFLTTNERAVDAVVYPRPRTKAARNLRVAHLPRFIFFPLPLCTTLLATIPGETWKGGPDEFQLYPLYLFPRPGQLYDSFPRAEKTNREGLR